MLRAARLAYAHALNMSVYSVQCIYVQCPCAHNMSLQIYVVYMLLPRVLHFSAIHYVCVSTFTLYLSIIICLLPDAVRQIVTCVDRESGPSESDVEVRIAYCILRIRAFAIGHPRVSYSG